MFNIVKLTATLENLISGKHYLLLPNLVIVNGEKIESGKNSK